MKHPSSWSATKAVCPNRALVTCYCGGNGGFTVRTFLVEPTRPHSWAGVEFPTGDSKSTPPLGSGSYDYFLGASADYEGRTWLLFGTARDRFNTENDEAVKNGNVFLYDLALGWRPVKTNYLKPDWVFMVELNGQVFAPREIGGVELTQTKASRLFGAAGLWLTYRNWAFKPGVQFPIYQNFDVDDFKSDYSAVFAVEVHF